LQESVEHLSSRLHVAPAGNSLYRITVTDANANRAAAIADEAGRQASALFLQLNTQSANTAIDQSLARSQDDLRQQYTAASTARITFQLQHPNASASKDVKVAVQMLQLQAEEDSAAAAFRGSLDQANRVRLNGLELAAAYDARLTDKAVARPDTGGRTIEILSAAALALLIGVALIFLLEYLDNAVREPDVAEDMLGAPVIGIIPRANPHSLRTARGGA
jgi:capsular polysaccharide biosynthesis protein